MFTFPHRLSLAVLIVVLLAPASAAGQTPPKGVGSVTFAWQWIDNTGHILTDGRFSDFSKSVTTSVLAEIDYGVTERFAATVGVPFVFARYTGSRPPPSNEERDWCRCWQQSLQDLSFAGRYRFGVNDPWTVTPQVRVILPSHNYPYLGEAVAGPSLSQVLLSINGAWRLTPKAAIQAGYTFALVEEAAEDVRANRSHVFASFGYALTHSLYVHGGGVYQKTHGGYTALEIFSAPPNSVQRQQGDRLLKMRYVHLTAGLSYSVGSAAELFFSLQPYVWGRDTHDGIAYTVGATWHFDLSGRKSGRP